MAGTGKSIDAKLASEIEADIAEIDGKPDAPKAKPGPKPKPEPEHFKDCEICMGTGLINEHTLCEACSGSGRAL